MGKGSGCTLGSRVQNEGKKYFVTFIEDGTWKDTGYEINKKTIPSNVANVLKDEFGGYKILEAQVLDTNEGSGYEFEIKRDNKQLEVFIDNNGNVVEQKIDTDSDKDN